MPSDLNEINIIASRGEVPKTSKAGDRLSFDLVEARLTLPRITESHERMIAEGQNPLRLDFPEEGIVAVVEIIELMDGSGDPVFKALAAQSLKNLMKGGE